MHQLGARLAQEDVRITGCAFTKRDLPDASARCPPITTGSCTTRSPGDTSPAPTRGTGATSSCCRASIRASGVLTKTPAHTWTLPQLMHEYPRTRSWCRRTAIPAQVMASTATLIATLRRLGTDEIDPADIADEFQELIFDGLERTVDARLSGVVPHDQVVDVLFTDLMADPLAAAATVYERLGFVLDAATEARMAAFVVENARGSGVGATTRSPTPASTWRRSAGGPSGTAGTSAFPQEIG